MSFIQTLSGKQLIISAQLLTTLILKISPWRFPIFAASPDIFLNFIAWRSIPYCAASLYHRSLPLKP